MAVQFSAISNNWGDATWQTVNSIGYLKSEAASTATTTSYVASTAFTAGAVMVEGILLRIKGTTATPTGTFSVELFNSTGSLSIATVTCNATDIKNNNTGLDGGWVYFKFSSAQLLIAATNYQIRVKSSVAGTVTVYRDATAGNWSRGLVTTTTASLAASDDVIICGNITAAATTAVNTVTFNNTSATTYASLEVGSYGKLIGQNSASTNYVLTIGSTGMFRVAHNGIVEFSTTGSRLPSSSTFVITMTNATNGDNFIDVRNFGTFRAVGATKTRKDTLAANAAVAATSLTTSTSTGWKNGDNIGIAGTGATNQQQQRTLSVDASGTGLTISAGLTFATLGTSPVQADVINLTSNFKIQGTSTSLASYIRGYNTSVIEVDQIEFQFMGTSNAIGGIYTKTNNGSETTGSLTVTNCAFWNTANANTNMISHDNNFRVAGIYVDGCVSYSAGTSCNHLVINPYASLSGISSYHKNCVLIGGSVGFTSLNNDYTIQVIDNITVANCATAGFGAYGYTKPLTSYSLINNCKFYASTYGMYCVTAASSYTFALVSFTNCTFYRCTYGIYLTSNVINVQFDSCTAFGNTGGNIRLGNCNDCKFINCSFQGGTTVVSPYGIVFESGSGRKGIKFERCLFGTVTTHTSGEINADSFSTELQFNNCTCGSATLVANPRNMTGLSKISFQRLNGTAGNHKTYVENGVMSNDTIIYDSSPNSWRLTPNVDTSASTNVNFSNFKMRGTIFQIAVANGSVATISIKVRKSVIGDGTAYNGAQPRLILKSNPSAGSGYNADIVAATATNAANGAWETLTYTLPAAVTDNVGMEFYVDCSGTTGWINIDTIVIS